MLKYIGNGAALVVDQVPARDLTDEEVAQFGEDMLLASGLYVKVERAQGGPAKHGKAYSVGNSDKESLAAFATGEIQEKAGK